MRTPGARGGGHGLAWLMLAALAWGPLEAEDRLLVVRKGDQLVFTNTPSHGNAREVTRTRSAVAPGSASVTSLYDPLIRVAAREAGLSVELVKAVAIVESGLDPHAVSVKGAQGLMQLMPETAEQYAVDDAFDPLQNLRAGSRHLRDLLEMFDWDLTLALAAYNAGAGAVRQSGGVPDYPETLEYLGRIERRLGRRLLPPDAGRRRAAPPPKRPVRTRRLPDGTLLLVN